LNRLVCGSIVMTTAVLAGMSLSPAPVRGQTTKKGAPVGGVTAPPALDKRATPKQPAPRTRDGKPDLSGVWWAPGSRGESPTNSIFGGFSINIAQNMKPEDVPFQPWAKKLYEERMASEGKDDPEGYCLPSGVPRTNPYPYKIIQTPGVAIVLYEGNIHSFRQVFLDKKTHSADLDPTWFGESIGHWEGDTLVVDTTGLNDKTWLDGNGHPHSDALHVIERYSRPEMGRLVIDITIDDPKAYTKPWTVHESSTLAVDWELHEYICNENNRDVGHYAGK
jgi:hypothetical protein